MDGGFYYSTSIEVMLLEPVDATTPSASRAVPAWSLLNGCSFDAIEHELKLKGPQSEQQSRTLAFTMDNVVKLLSCNRIVNRSAG